MKRVAGYAGSAFVALLFGSTVALIEPYPYSYGLVVWAFSALLFVAVYAKLSAQNRMQWMLYGVLTFACRVIAEFWFDSGWWLPPHPNIVHWIFQADGEASYDAHIAELFLVLWLFVSIVFAVRQTRTL